MSWAYKIAALGCMFTIIFAPFGVIILELDDILEQMKKQGAK